MSTNSGRLRSRLGAKLARSEVSPDVTGYVDEQIAAVAASIPLFGAVGDVADASGSAKAAGSTGKIADAAHAHHVADAVAGGASGLMSGADKLKLDGVAAGAQAVTFATIQAALAASVSRPASFVQTYSATDRTVAAATAGVLDVGTISLPAIIAVINQLVADQLGTRKNLNALIDDSQALGWTQT